MSKIRYNKPDLENIIMTQLENLNVQGEHIRLIKEQNELLLKQNHKLIGELSDKLKKTIPYPTYSKKPS